MKKRYVDGFVLPVANDRLAEYEAVVAAVSKIYQEHGALEYWECAGEDLDIEGVRSFRELAQAKDGETVMFSWAVFASKEARDAANKELMSDPRLVELMNPDNPLFDATRLAFGGFRELIGGKPAVGD